MKNDSIELDFDLNKETKTETLVVTDESPYDPMKIIEMEGDLFRAMTKPKEKESMFITLLKSILSLFLIILGFIIQPNHYNITQ